MRNRIGPRQSFGFVYIIVANLRGGVHLLSWTQWGQRWSLIVFGNRTKLVCEKTLQIGAESHNCISRLDWDVKQSSVSLHALGTDLKMSSEDVTRLFCPLSSSNMTPWVCVCWALLHLHTHTVSCPKPRLYSGDCLLRNRAFWLSRSTTEV